MNPVYPGLPAVWGLGVVVFAAAASLWFLRAPPPAPPRAAGLSLARLPGLAGLMRGLRHPAPLLAARLVFAGLFLFVIVAGLFGDPSPRHNAATVLTWTFWWTGVALSIFFLGSAWCAVCPWDSLATWLVRRRLRRRRDAGLQWRVPRGLQNTWPAAALLVVLIWLELGAGVSASPFATALVALALLALAALSLAVFERKAFCRYFCPVGRSVGAYSQLAPVSLGPVDGEVCRRCTVLACYHGTERVEPCPTHLVIGRARQTQYCTSCGACLWSCPYHNVAWSLRPLAAEVVSQQRTRWDEAGFVLALVMLTSFYGLTRLPAWEEGMQRLGWFVGDTGGLRSFTLALAAGVALPVVLYAAMVALSARLSRTGLSYRRLFVNLAYTALPLAFAYHLAHNLNYLLREAGGMGAVLADPLGRGAPPAPATLVARPLLPEAVLHASQAALMGLGFWLALKILRHRVRQLGEDGPPVAPWRVSPVLAFLLLIGGFNLWLLMQPMVARF